MERPGPCMQRGGQAAFVDRGLDVRSWRAKIRYFVRCRWARGMGNAGVQCDGWVMHVRKTNQRAANGQSSPAHCFLEHDCYSYLTRLTCLFPYLSTATHDGLSYARKVDGHGRVGRVAVARARWGRKGQAAPALLCPGLSCASSLHPSPLHALIGTTIIRCRVRISRFRCNSMGFLSFPWGLTS
jgi:hypothetical protein